MGAGDLSPDNAELVSSLRNLGLVDISDFLAKVVVGGLLIIASLNLDKIGMVISIGASTISTIRIYMNRNKVTHRLKPRTRPLTYNRTG